MRLDKFLREQNLGTRSQLKKDIQAGLVSVNGITALSPQQQIARYIGSAREVVSRMLKYFASEGMVEVSRKGVKILDRKHLRKLTC